jgi:hypothetical protein
MELLLGIDDTDMLDSPGTNKLAIHLAQLLAPEVTVRMILRHQLFFDPRVPYTSHNGSASLLLEVADDFEISRLADTIRPVIEQWCPEGSDPGFCITRQVPAEIVEFAQRCQYDVVSQAEALDLAAKHGIHLEVVGGTGDGIIGALAAVGLLSTRNDGRVLHFGRIEELPYDITGYQVVATLLSRGVGQIECRDTGEVISSGAIKLGKRLRPNLRAGNIVLYVVPNVAEDSALALWEAVKVV